MRGCRRAMPRVIVFGKSQRRTTRKVRHIVRAFREQGNETLWLNPAKIKRWIGTRTEKYILKRIKTFNPDIVFIFSMDIPLPVLHQISGTRIKTVQFFVDSWRLSLLPKVAEWGRLVDLFLVSARGLHEQYKAAGIKNPIFFTDACDKHEHKRRNPILSLWKSDVAFIGAARGNEPRVLLIQRLNELFKVKVYGKNWAQFGINPTLKVVGPKGYGLICAGAKIFLGADATSNIDGHWSNRLWLTLGCGGFLLTNYVPGLEEFFVNHEHLVWYHDEDECIGLVQEYLSKPLARKKIADQGYRLVHEHHTFHHFVDRVITQCNKIRKL
jgi:spore maturation protein CgeB